MGNHNVNKFPHNLLTVVMTDIIECLLLSRYYCIYLIRLFSVVLIKTYKWIVFYFYFTRKKLKSRNVDITCSHHTFVSDRIWILTQPIWLHSPCSKLCTPLLLWHIYTHPKLICMDFNTYTPLYRFLRKEVNVKMESLIDSLLKCYDGNNGIYFTFPARISSCLSLLANPVIAAVSIIPVKASTGAILRINSVISHPYMKEMITESPILIVFCVKTPTLEPVAYNQT